jgi:phosphoribosylformimino-5-aminoimidazole carboxamide ribotide isomerase
MELYPAVDIRDGTAVRLTQGDFDRQREYGDPATLAGRFVDAGARWLHVVDLDAARAGRPVNRATVLAIARSVDASVEAGGGVRTEADVEELLEGGVARVVLGTVVLDDMDLVHRVAARFTGRVAVGIDYRLGADGRSEVAVRGWEQGSGRTVDAVLGELAGSDVAAVIVTAIARDGTLEGPDRAGLEEVLGATAIPVIASGGVGTAADLRALAHMQIEVAEASGPEGSTGRGSGDDWSAEHGSSVGDGASGQRGQGGQGGQVRRLAGAITGRALVDGRLTVEEGLAACAQSG